MRFPNNNTFRIHSLESFGIHDGPGIRFVIFLQACNMRCVYCHNPDTIQIHGGTVVSIESLVERAERMKPYFSDKGGVTVSGGEPMLQAKALVHFFEILSQKNIHTNIDTNGTIRSEASQILLSECADLVMFDIKATTHKKFVNITGTNKLDALLANIALREAAKKPYWLRYVLIPGITDSAQSFQWLIDSFRHARYLERVEILPYHTLGVQKWKSLGMQYALEGVNPPTDESVQQIKTLLRSYFQHVP